MTNLHVLLPKYEHLHTFFLIFTCRAPRCLTNSDKLITWVRGEQSLERALTMKPVGPSQTPCWFFLSTVSELCCLPGGGDSTCRQALAPGAISLRNCTLPSVHD